MSWLADREVKHRYKMPDGSIRHLVLPASVDAQPSYLFDDFVIGVYDGFEPEIVKQTNVVEYDKNGRKAVMVRDKNGKTSHISKTKLNYLKTGKTESQYTKEYQEHLMKTKQHELLRSGVGKGRGKASKTSPRDDLLKNLPDGEYVSDGTNVMPAPAGMGDDKK